MNPDDPLTFHVEGEWKSIDERAWLSWLGPTAYLIGRHIHSLDCVENPIVVSLKELGSFCGVKPSKARDALARLGMFNLIHRADPVDRPGQFTIVGDWSTVPTRRTRNTTITEGESK